jgi:hypothetical protein
LPGLEAGLSAHFGPALHREQRDPSFAQAGRSVGEEIGDLAQRGSQAGQIEGDAPEKSALIGGWAGTSCFSSSLASRKRSMTWARRNLDQIRGKLAIRIYVGNQDPGLAGNRRMHALLDELRIPHGYQEFDGIAHNLRLLAENVKAENFAFAGRSFKLLKIKEFTGR